MAGRNPHQVRRLHPTQTEEVGGVPFGRTLLPRAGIRPGHALSFEARQTLATHRPATLGQASRISGITPATISLLLIHLKKGRFKGFAANEQPGRDAA